MSIPIPKTLAQPAQRALAGERIASLEDLHEFTEKQVSDLNGMGPNGMKKLKEAMTAAGIDFRAVAKSIE